MNVTYKIYRVKTRPSQWPWRYEVINGNGRHITKTFTKWGAKREVLRRTEPIKLHKEVL